MKRVIFIPIENKNQLEGKTEQRCSEQTRGGNRLHEIPYYSRVVGLISRKAIFAFDSPSKILFPDKNRLIFLHDSQTFNLIF